jgi:hypothetical protein
MALFSHPSNVGARAIFAGVTVLACKGATSKEGEERSRAPEELVGEWNYPHIEPDLDGFERLYAERVRFYGQSLTRAEVIERKRQLFARVPSFSQMVLSTMSIERKGELTRVGFKKRSGPEGAENDAFGTLVFGKAPEFFIQEESEAAPIKKFGGRSAFAAAPVDCDSAVWFLVESTPDAKWIQAEIDEHLRSLPKGTGPTAGGIGPLTPNETRDGTYLLAIGVHHPERFEAYEWYTVDADGNATESGSPRDPLRLDNELSPSTDSQRRFRELCQRK